MAEQLGYKYVLLLRVKPSINRGHGRFERNVVEEAAAPMVCFADTRIRDKWIGRGPNFWRKRSAEQGFDPGDPGRHCLTGQKGWWGFAMGIEDETIPLRKIVSSDEGSSQDSFDCAGYAVPPLSRVAERACASTR